MRATLWWAVGLTFTLLIIPSGIPSRAQTTNELRPPASFEVPWHRQLHRRAGDRWGSCISWRTGQRSWKRTSRDTPCKSKMSAVASCYPTLGNQPNHLTLELPPVSLALHVPESKHLSRAAPAD